MKLGSLCSGAGGLDMAVEQVFGADTVWHCELDPAASKVLAHRWPGVPNHGDLITTDWSSVEPVDIMCFGWPCQPFSLAGKRKGHEDERAIWPHIADAVRVLRPRICVMENVSAVLRHEFQRVADSMAALGYDLRWTCLRASDVGAPHRRERLFVVAVDTTGDAVIEWYDATADAYRDERQRRWRASLSQTDRPSSFGSTSLPLINLLPSPRTSDANGAGAHGDGGLDLRTTVALLPTPQARDSAGAKTPEQVEAAAGQFGPPMNLNDYVVNEAARWGKYAPAIAHWEQIAGPAPSPTEPNRNGNPRLNPAFSEWMMGWPAGWVTDVPGITRNDALRIIGNGVVPQQAAAALQWLLSLQAVA